MSSVYGVTGVIRSDTPKEREILGILLSQHLRGRDRRGRLPDCSPRACDLAARRQLGRGQGGRVFPAPCRAALAGVATMNVAT